MSSAVTKSTDEDLERSPVLVSVNVKSVVPEFPSACDTLSIDISGREIITLESTLTWLVQLFPLTDSQLIRKFFPVNSPAP